MSNKQYVYMGEFILEDGTTELLDLEEHGWADKERLAKTTRLSLVPKPGNPDYPVVAINIPKGGKPVFKTRLVHTEGHYIPGADEPWNPKNIKFPVGFEFRLYSVGYKLGRSSHLLWIMPGGNGIEVCPDDPHMIDILNVALINLTYARADEELLRLWHSGEMEAMLNVPEDQGSGEKSPDGVPLDCEAGSGVAQGADL